MQIETNGLTIELFQGDITKQDTDAIVNAANNQLAHGGGVAKAIAQAAGKELIAESEAIDYVETGEVATTTGGDLDAKYVIHAVGPVWNGGDQGEAELLRSCIQEALKMAEELQLGSISFPAISTGIFGYPIKDAASEMIDTAISWSKDNENTTIKQIRFVLFSDEDYTIFKKQLDQRH